MSQSLERTMTLEEFLAWDRHQELRHEFDGERPVLMVGESFAHSLIAGNLHAYLHGRLAGGPCSVIFSSVKIDVPGKVRYPDVLVTCVPLDPASHVVREPVVIFEVLSPSTSSTDFIKKNDEYSRLPSVQNYVLLHQDRRAAVMFSRDGEDWVSRIVLDTLRLPAIGVELPMALLYAGVSPAATD